MDSPTLVEADLDAGRDLVAALEAESFPVDLAIWGYDPEVGDWRLFIASRLVDDLGRLATYERIQRTLRSSEGWSRLAGRLTVISPSDGGVKDLKRLLKAENFDDTEVRVGGVALGGRTFDDGYAYQPDALEYELEVFKALQRVVPSFAVIRRGDRVFDAPGRFDFVVAGSERQVLVEAKARRRPLSQSELASILGRVPPRWALIIVSSSGSTARSKEVPKEQPGSWRLVTWRSREDDGELASAIRALL